MVKFKALALSALLVPVLAGCLTTGTQSAAPQAHHSRIDGEYANILAGQYDAAGALFSVNGQDRAAAAFRGQSARAMLGDWAEPQSVPPETGTPEMEESRAVLMMALTQVMNAENALWLARAQVNFDCWALTLEESCRRDFDKAMRSLTIPAESMQTQSVYFDADSSILNPDTREKLMKTATMLRMNKMVNVRLTGFTDHPARNQSLALRRAIAVRNLLTQMGVALDRIAVKDENHGDTILSQQTPEDGGDAQARRVDIILEPVFGQAI